MRTDKKNNMKNKTMRTDKKNNMKNKQIQDAILNKVREAWTPDRTLPAGTILPAAPVHEVRVWITYYEGEVVKRSVFIAQAAEPGRPLTAAKLAARMALGMFREGLAGVHDGDKE